MSKSSVHVLSIGTMVAIVLSLSSCASMSRSDRAMLREIESYGLGKQDERVKDPVVAGVLNILPGIGNFYLAVGTEQGDQWIYGALNLLFWPISPIWGVPEAAIDAGTINKQATVYYYRYDQMGKLKFEKAKAHVYKRVAIQEPETAIPAPAADTAKTKLEKLVALKEKGLLTEEEYQLKRQAILNAL